MLENEIDLFEDSMFWFGSNDQQEAWQRIKAVLIEKTKYLTTSEIQNNVVNEICNNRINGKECLFFAFRKCTDIPCVFHRKLS